MGEIVGLCIGSYEFLSRKNTFGDLLSIFSQDDLTIEEVFDKELDESITRRYFTTTVNNAKMCLDVMGHTTLYASGTWGCRGWIEAAGRPAECQKGIGTDAGRKDGVAEDV